MIIEPGMHSAQYQVYFPGSCPISRSRYSRVVAEKKESGGIMRDVCQIVQTSGRLENQRGGFQRRVWCGTATYASTAGVWATTHQCRRKLKYLDRFSMRSPDKGVPEGANWRRSKSGKRLVLGWMD